MEYLSNKKMAFRDRTKRMEDKIDTWLGRGTDKIDAIILFAILGMFFFLFVQTDILVTGNRSFLMYRDLMDFYDASYKWEQGYGANYLPSTFWVFAIWNFPLYIAGFFPKSVEVYSLAIFWYKLLPVIVFFTSSYLLKRVALKIGAGDIKSRICQYVFLMSPIAIYSQFVFSQYDIFTVFFMLLGLLYFLDNRKSKFVAFFGIAITFKYYALVYFLVLLVLKEKRILRIIGYTSAVLLPASFETVFYVKSFAFRQSVFGFSALDTVMTPSFWLGVGNISILFMIVLILFCLAYMHSYSIAWTLCLLNGVNFAFFGCNYWNPQWLLISIPFIALAIISSKYGDLLLLVELVFSVALWIRVSTWNGVLDTGLLKNGILRGMLANLPITSSTADVYAGIDILFVNTIFVAAYFVFFILTMPRYQYKKEKERSGEKNGKLLAYMRMTFCVGILCFLFPMIPSVKDMLAGKIYFLDVDLYGTKPIALNLDDEVRQTFTADGSMIEEISVVVGTYGRINDSNLLIQLLNQENEVIYSGQRFCGNVKDNTWCKIIDETIPVKKGEIYTLVVTTDASDGQNVALYTNVNYAGDERASIYDDGKLDAKEGGQLSIKIMGRE